MREQSTIICPGCDTAFSPKNPRQKYCSRSCSSRMKRRASLADRFWRRIDKPADPDACWLWPGQLHSKGYGLCGKSYAHRVSYVLHHGPVPEGLMVCHSCDVRHPVGDTTYRRCCNPLHLWVGSAKQNSEDMVAKGRQPAGERHMSKTHPEAVHAGEDHHWSKLTADKVRELRALIAQGVDHEALAQRFGISRRSVRDIRDRKSWKRVA